MELELTANKDHLLVGLEEEMVVTAKVKVKKTHEKRASKDAVEEVAERG